MIAGQSGEDSLLDAAGVLVFVDEDVIEAASFSEPHRFVVGKEFLDHQQQVIKVDRPGEPERLLIASVAGGRQRP